ncbi:MAG: CheY-P-specific phosphatase CheC [Actinobacteria bacterium]|nr:MAG: CheY-P-specific phosphatase CheC [Actinomycetota bacterium]
MNEMGLKDLERSALLEIGSIGAGHAATALSELVDQKVMITVPKLQIVPVHQVPDLVGGPEELVAAIYVRVMGDVRGSMLFLVPRESAIALIDLLQGHELGQTKVISETDEELLKQTGNILAMAYLNSLTRLTDLIFLPSPPAFAFDMVGAILDSIMTEAGMAAEQAIVVSTEFVHIADHVDAMLFFLPKPETLSVILAHLGVE